MPRWVLFLIGLIAVVWMISDPAGFAGTIKNVVGSLITVVKELSK